MTLRFRSLLAAGLALALTLGAARARPARALEERGDLARSLQEVRLCPDPLQTPSAWTGTRWACDGLEVAKALVRRVGELVAGIDLTGTGRGENSLLDTYGFSDDDKQLLRGTFFANFYLPTELTGSTAGSASPSIGGASTGPEGEVRAAATTSPQTITDWNTFAREVMPPTMNPLGKAAILGLAMVGRFGQLTEAFGAIAQPGQILPQIKGEGAPASAGSRLTDEIVYPQAVLAQANAALVASLAPAIAAAGGIFPAPLPVSSPALPTAPLAADGIRGPPTKAADLKPTETGRGSSTSTELVTGQTADSSGLRNLACPTCGGFDRGLSGINGIFSGNAFARALRYFGGDTGRLGNLGSLLGPDLFSRFLGERFGGGGESGTPPRHREDPPTGPCAAKKPSLTGEEVRDLVDFLGLPPAERPWVVEFRPVASLLGVRATDLRTFEEVTVSAESFAGDACVWAVTATQEDGTQATALVSDRRGEGTLLGVSSAP